MAATQHRRSRHSNGEGYDDFTAADAIRSADAEYTEMCRCISQVKRIIRICGFELEGRIVLKGKSGRIYR